MKQFQITVITEGKREVLFRSFENSFDAAVWAQSAYAKSNGVKVMVKEVKA